MSIEKGNIDNKGYLYENKNKNNVKQPDWKGKITINGKEYLIGAWEKKDNNNEKFYSLSLTDPATLPPKNNNQQKHNNQNSFNTTSNVGPLDSFSKQEKEMSEKEAEEILDIFNDIDSVS